MMVFDNLDARDTPMSMAARYATVAGRLMIEHHGDLIYDADMIRKMEPGDEVWFFVRGTGTSAYQRGKAGNSDGAFTVESMLDLQHSMPAKAVFRVFRREALFILEQVQFVRGEDTFDAPPN